MSMRERVTDLLRRWRVARYQRRQVIQAIRDERNAEHLDRVRKGINDVHHGGFGGSGFGGS